MIISYSESATLARIFEAISHDLGNVCLILIVIVGKNFNFTSLDLVRSCYILHV